MATSRTARALLRAEWPTFLLFLGVYAGYAALTLWGGMAPLIATLLLSPLITLHSSLQHETMHILEPHAPFVARILTFPALGLLVPYIRFRDTHLDHHQNDLLTDPYDDPETQYLVPELWAQMPRFLQAVFNWNGTLLGRVTIGPLVGFISFVIGDVRLARAGDARVVKGWLWHIPAVLVVALWLMTVSTLPLWAYAVAVYLSHSLLKIRTYLEHRAHDIANARSAIVEDRGILAFLFLNNNFHAVHHVHPRVSWFNLPSLYERQREKFLKANEGYRYASYGVVFKEYFTKHKEPVSHPIWSLANRTQRWK